MYMTLRKTIHFNFKHYFQLVFSTLSYKMHAAEVLYLYCLPDQITIQLFEEK